MSDEMKIIKRPCAGGCGVVLHYRLERASELYTPDLTCLDGYAAYRGDHLCVHCDAAVAEVLLARRRERRQRKAWAREREARQARVRAHTGTRR